jgi:phytoene dehydrogenase-like protein
MSADTPTDKADAGRVDGGRTDIVVIGAGHNGLAAAFYLAKAGRRVLVLEQRDEVGGGAITGEIHPGFACPTLSHEVLLHERIARDMRLHEHGVEILVPPVDVTALSPDGPPLVLDRDVARAAQSIAQHPTYQSSVSQGGTSQSGASRDRSRQNGHADAEAYVRFVATRDRFAGVLADLLTVPAPRLDRVSIGDVWHLLHAGRRFRSLGERNASQMLRWLPMPVADLLTETFENDLLRAALAGPGLSGAGMGPRSGGSVLLLLMRAAHAQLAGGPGRRVRGGPGRLTRAMAAAARGAGVEIRTSHLVERILVHGGRVSGVAIGRRRGGARDIGTQQVAGRDVGEDRISARTVVSAVDPKTTFGRLIGPGALAPGFAARVRNVRASGTLAKVNLALSALPRFHGIGVDTHALSGRVHLGPTLDYMEHAFDCVKYGEVSPEPWLDVTFPSIVDPSLAPAGMHVASIYVHYVPFVRHPATDLPGPDGDATRGQLLDTVMRVLERYAPGVTSLVLATQVITPADLEADYGFGGGHISHAELALDQLFSMRPVFGHATYDSPIAGLYLCGAGTHPGGFLCGASGRLAAERVVADDRWSRAVGRR